MWVRTTRTLPVPPESNWRFDFGPSSLRDPLFGGPGDNRFDYLRDQEKHDGAAEVFAHGFHVSRLKCEGGNSHKEGGGGDYRRGQTGAGTRILQQILILHCKSSRLRRDAGSSVAGCAELPSIVDGGESRDGQFHCSFHRTSGEGPG